MGQVESEVARHERPENPLGTYFAEFATDDQVRYAIATAQERLAVAESAHHLVILQAISALHARALSTRDIAGVVDISKSAVNRHLRKGDYAVAVRYASEIISIVRQAWRGLTRPEGLSTVLERAEQRRDNARADELRRAIDAGEEPGHSWPYRLTVYRFGTDSATRESLAQTLRQSAWMAAAIARVGAPESCTLWHLWAELRDVRTIADYDRIVRAIHELAEQDGCWIEFVEPPRPTPDLGR